MKSIILIEDNVAIQEVTKVILESEGYRVRAFINAEDFFAELRTLKPDLILLDYRLPDMMGDVMIAKIKQREFFHGVKIIVFSADHKVEERSLQAGADDFISKPFDIAVLTKKIREHLA
jgi:two-component system, OmpR family, phosphate regulon response regulator PhoB